MINVGIVPSQPFHHSLGTDVRLINLIQSLAKYDVEIHFITPFKCDIFPENKKIHIHAPTEYPLDQWLIEKVYGITRTFFNKPFWSRNLVRNKFALNKITSSFAMRVQKLTKKLDLDIILGELEIASMACIKIRESLNIPVIADIHGGWSEEIIAANIIQEGSYEADIMRKFEWEILHSADAVIVVSEEAKNFFRKFYYLSASKITVVPGGAFPRVERAKNDRKPSKIVFSGMITYREHVDLLIKSMPLVINKCPSAKFYLTKKGDKLQEVMRLAAAMHLNPEFFYYPSTEGFFNFLKTCHIGVLTSSQDISRKIAYPAKLFDYMSVGLPVVSNDVGTWTKIIKEYGIGIVTEDSPHEFAKAILELLKNPNAIYEYGQRGINLIKTRFNYDLSAKILYDLIRRMKSKPGKNQQE